MQNYCILDGGFPIYKNGIALSTQKFNKRHLGQTIRFGPYHIGTIYGGYDGFYFYRFRKCRMYLGNVELTAISLFLGFDVPLIKFIPLDPSKTFQPDTNQCLRFETINSKKTE